MVSNILQKHYTLKEWTKTPGQHLSRISY